MRLNQNFALIFLLPLFLLSCHSKEQAVESSDYSVHGDTVIIDKSSPLQSKIKTAIVLSIPYKQTLLTAGTVKAIPTQYAEIAPPFQGRVTKSYLRLGMKTTAEMPLFEISSPDFIAAQKVFFQEKSQLQQAEKTLKRQQDLIANGVGTQKDMEEAQTAFEVAKKEFENASIGIKIFKADPNKISMGQALVVRSPIAGEVIENRVVLGQFIKDDAASVATVAELSKIWIVGQVKEKDIRYIHQLADCEIDIAAFPEMHLKGTVYHVNEMVNEETRSVEILITVDNSNHLLKPGMYVTVNFSENAVNAILIPAKAVLQMNDASFVLLKTLSNAYVKKKVIIAGTAGENVVIQSGLNQGDTIISEGGFYLTDAK